MTTIHSYVQSKEVTYKELLDNFAMVMEVAYIEEPVGVCPYCMTNHNTKYIPSEPWTKVLYCWKCESITMKVEADRMGGSDMDLYRVFRKEK